MERPASVIVVGAGVFGLTGALELRRRGHAVTLLDPGPLPRDVAASTDLSKAVRTDYGADEEYSRLMERAIVGWRAWNHVFGEILFHECGVVFLSENPMAPGGFEHDSYGLARQRGVAVERLDRNTLPSHFPAWSEARFAEGYFNPVGGWAASGRVMARLLGMARAEGVDVHEGAPVTALLSEDERVDGVQVRGGAELRAGLVLLAAGAWTPVLLPELAIRLRPSGHPTFVFRPQDPGPFHSPGFTVWGADIALSGWYGFPALPDGRVKVARHGPGRPLHPDAERRVAEHEVEQCRAVLRTKLPGLASAPLDSTRLCLYCDTEDGDFLIDHHPERPGLVVASGGCGHAFKFAPVLGELIADVVDGIPNDATARFAWRRPARGRGEPSRAR